MLNIQQLIPRYTTIHDPEAVPTFITTHLKLVLILSFLSCVSFHVSFFTLGFTTIFFYVLQTFTVYGVTVFKNPANSGTTSHEIKAAFIGMVFGCAGAQLTHILCLILFPSF